MQAAEVNDAQRVLRRGVHLGLVTTYRHQLQRLCADITLNRTYHTISQRENPAVCKRQLLHQCWHRCCCCAAADKRNVALLLLRVQHCLWLWLLLKLMLLILKSLTATQATLKAIQKQTGLKELSLRDVPMDSFQVCYERVCMQMYVWYTHSEVSEAEDWFRLWLCMAASLCYKSSSMGVSQQTASILALSRHSISKRQAVDPSRPCVTLKHATCFIPRTSGVHWAAASPGN
jgi:hypothetical protein